MAEAHACKNYAHFFHQSKRAPYLFGCLLYHHFTHMRVEALSMIVQAYRLRKFQTRPLSLEEFTSKLSFNTDLETVEFLAAFHVTEMDVRLIFLLFVKVTALCLLFIAPHTYINSSI